MMRFLKLTVTHTRWMLLDLLRQPAYVVSTIAFPALFYLIFAVPESNETGPANFLMASFASFAVFGVVFLQFGVGLAQERTQSWYQFLRTLPFPAGGFLIARFFTATAFSLLAVATIFILAIALTPAELPILVWMRVLAVLVGGGLTFCFMGLALGFWTSEKSALPIGNLIYLPLSFLGGLWKPPEILPTTLRSISEFLPTRQYGELVWATIRQADVRWQAVAGLSSYALAFAALAAWGFWRDQDKRRGI